VESEGTGLGLERCMSINGFTGLYVWSRQHGVGLVYSGGMGPLQD